MLYLKWNDKKDKTGAMKQSRLFMSKKEFNTWYSKNKSKIKNVLIPAGSGLKKSDLK